MSNSPLVNYTKISPNKTSPRNHVIDTITIHCVVGQCSVETIGEIFSHSSKEASCNYGIGYDGKIALIVDEKDRSWCSSNSANDNRAITIEVASDTKHPYSVNDAAYKSLINLLVDICQRNGIKELKWKADKSLIGQVDKQNMTVHRWFANKSCPGEYLYSRHGQIAREVNARLGVSGTKPIAPSEPPKKSPSNEELYPTVKYGNTGTYVKKAQEYLNKFGASLDVDGIFGNLTLSAVKSFQKSNDLVVDGIIGPNTWAALKSVKNELNVPYKVSVSINDLNIRKGPGTNYATTGSYTGIGVFTIVDVRSGAGSKTGWGKLKSGAGWISLDFTKRV